ncbi:MAG: cytochrome c [Burkholderiales bacterium]
MADYNAAIACLALALLTSSFAAAQTESVKPDSTKTPSAPIAAGRAKADAACATCHGKNGYSQLPNAPHLAGQPEIYLREQLKAYRSGKRAHEVMAVIAKPLTDDDISNLAAWYSSIEIKVGERQ